MIGGDWCELFAARLRRPPRGNAGDAGAHLARAAPPAAEAAHAGTRVRAAGHIRSCLFLATCSSSLRERWVYVDVKMMCSFLCAQRLVQRDSWAIPQVSLDKNNIHVPL